jgi:hypothetical protein
MKMANDTKAAAQAQPILIFRDIAIPLQGCPADWDGDGC